MQLELDKPFRYKGKRLFELNLYSDKVGRRTKRNIHVVASNWQKLSRITKKKNVQLAVNLGLKTLQIVLFVFSIRNTLQHIVEEVYENVFIVLVFNCISKFF